MGMGGSSGIGIGSQAQTAWPHGVAMSQPSTAGAVLPRTGWAVSREYVRKHVGGAVEARRETRRETRREARREARRTHRRDARCRRSFLLRQPIYFVVRGRSGPDADADADADAEADAEADADADAGYLPTLGTLPYDT